MHNIGFLSLSDMLIFFNSFWPVSDANTDIFPSVFPTHWLYLGGPPRYINGRPSIFGDTFLFLLLLLSLTTFFLSARDNETIRDWLTSGKSPLPNAFRRLLVLCAQELSTLPQTISSVSHTLIYLWRAATISTAHCHQLPRLTQYLATFRPFWRLFFPITGTYWQT